jgi:hypothetical protein
MVRLRLLRVLTSGLTLTLLAVGTPALHEHRADTPALYDDECPLSMLAARSDQSGLPKVVDWIEPRPSVEIAGVPAPRGWFEASSLPFSPRGPPTSLLNLHSS